MVPMIQTPKIITARRVISRETIEKLYTQEELSAGRMHLSPWFNVKPKAEWFFLVFVFSVARESPATLRITVLSTTAIRIHKYTLSPGLLQAAPEITIDEAASLWVDLVKAHFEADERLALQKISGREMSKYTRWFKDNGAGDLTPPLEFVVNDLDYDPGQKLGPVLVQ